MFDHHEIVLANGSRSESFLPGDQALRSVDAEQRTELFKLFPDLANFRGTGCNAARRVLKRFEASVLLAQGNGRNRARPRLEDTVRLTT
jgi:hypothetical protein